MSRNNWKEEAGEVMQRVAIEYGNLENLWKELNVADKHSSATFRALNNILGVLRGSNAALKTVLDPERNSTARLEEEFPGAFL